MNGNKGIVRRDDFIFNEDMTLGGCSSERHHFKSTLIVLKLLHNNTNSFKTIVLHTKHK